MFIFRFFVCPLFSPMLSPWPTNFCSLWPPECLIPQLAQTQMANFANQKRQLSAVNPPWFWMPRWKIDTAPIPIWQAKKNSIPVVFLITTHPHQIGNYLNSQSWEHWHTCTSRWSNGGGQFSTRKIFKKFLGGWKIFPFHFLVNFDVFLVDFDAKTHMRGENLPKIPSGGGWKITTGTTPHSGGEKFLGIF